MRLLISLGAENSEATTRRIKVDHGRTGYLHNHTGIMRGLCKDSPCSWYIPKMSFTQASVTFQDFCRVAVIRMSPLPLRQVWHRLFCPGLLSTSAPCIPQLR